MGKTLASGAIQVRERVLNAPGGPRAVLLARVPIAPERAPGRDPPAGSAGSPGRRAFGAARRTAGARPAEPAGPVGRPPGEPGPAHRRSVERRRPAGRCREHRPGLRVPAAPGDSTAGPDGAAGACARPPAATCSTCRSMRSTSTGSNGWPRWGTPARQPARPASRSDPRRPSRYGAARRWPTCDGDEVTGLRARLERRSHRPGRACRRPGRAGPRRSRRWPSWSRLVRQHPLDEGLVVRLMTALYQLGPAGRRPRGIHARPPRAWPTSSGSIRAPSCAGCTSRVAAVDPCADAGLDRAERGLGGPTAGRPSRSRGPVAAGPGSSCAARGRADRARGRAEQGSTCSPTAPSGC